ncbi:MAG: GntR family transcriptional regulator [Lentisphaeria bacterium]|nr:GntR family transcriptional regulator [Lentisphaeria bacterium]
MIDIVDCIKRDISDGKYAGNRKLPGVRSFAERFQCSAGTVANALRTLADEGIIRTEHGRGTYLVQEDENPFKTFRGNQIVGAVLLRNSWMEALEELRDQYLHEGWFVSPYCSSNDKQDPEKEKHFLELAAQQNFYAVMLVGSPLVPLNTVLYKKLRRKGMKIVHLTHYKVDMADEVSILPDYRMAGALACSTLAQKGFTRYLYLDYPENRFYSPSYLLRDEGRKLMMKSLGIREVGKVVMRENEYGVAELTDLNQFRSLMKQELSDGKTAILSDSSVLVYRFRQYLQQAGMPLKEQPFQIAMSGVWEHCDKVCHVSFDYLESIRLAMDYIRDDSCIPTRPYCRTLEPRLFMKDELSI